MITFLKKSLVFLALVPYGAYALETATPPLIITLTNQVNFEFVHQCCNQAQELKTVLMKLLNELSEDMDYWNLQQLTTFSYFISKGPAAWFTDKAQEQELYEKIVFLKKALEKNAYYLGRIHYYLIKNYQAESAHDIEKYMRELLSLVHSCVSPEHAQPYDIVLPYQETSQQQWSQLLVSNQKNLNTFYYRMCDAYQGYKKPNHFRRNWLAYSALTASTVALAVYAFRNQKNIKEWYAKATTALQYYYKTHMYEPIKTSIKIMTDESTLQSYPNADTAKIEQEAFNDTIRAHYQRQNEEIEKPWYQKPLVWAADWLFPQSKNNTKKSFEEIEKIVRDANNGKVDDFLDARKVMSRNPKVSLAVRNLGSIYLLEAYHFKTEAIKFGAKIIHEIIPPLRLIIALSALFPTYLLGKSAYTIGKDTLHTINKRNILPLKNCTRLIHRMLNKYTNADEISPMDLGFIVFWISELKKQVTNLPKHDQCSFMEDLDDLLQNSLTVEQKKAVIHRMYGTYNFLAPS